MARELMVVETIASLAIEVANVCYIEFNLVE